MLGAGAARGKRSQLAVSHSDRTGLSNFDRSATTTERPTRTTCRMSRNTFPDLGIPNGMAS
jgi:hypothetical protein